MTSQLLKLGDTIWNPGDLSLVGPEGDTVRLTNKARDTLASLADAAGDVVANETLANTIWPETQVEKETISRVVAELREALGDRDEMILRTVPGTGFQLMGRWVEIPAPPTSSAGPHWAWYVAAGVVVLGILWVVTRGG